MISVAMCTYNGEKYVLAQLKSIMNQTRMIDEIVIVDDGSKDQTISLIQDYLKDIEISYQIIQNKKNIGVVKNFEKAISMCKGDYIFLSDQDDIWYPNKVEVMISAFDENTLGVFSNGDIIDCNGELTSQKLWSMLEVYPSRDSEKLFHDLLRMGLVTGAAFCIKKEIFEIGKPFSKLWVHDEWLGLLCSLFGEIQPVEQCLIQYRLHGQNTVGLTEYTFKNRLLTYIKRLKEGKHIRHKKMERYQEMVNCVKKQSIENNRIHDLNECYQFYLDITLKPNPITIIRHLMKGNYKKFSSGFNAFLRDMISLFFMK